jgi:hypothetical protein
MTVLIERNFQNKETRMAEKWGQWLRRTLVGRYDDPKPGPLPDKELLTGGTFRVLKDFRIRRENGRVALNEGDGPLLGAYWAGHDYAITPINAPAVMEAATAGLAVVVVPPRSEAL